VDQWIMKSNHNSRGPITHQNLTSIIRTHQMKNQPMNQI